MAQAAMQDADQTVGHDPQRFLVRFVPSPLSVAHRLDSIPARREALENNIRLAAESPGTLTGLVKWQTELTALLTVEPELEGKVVPLSVKLAEVREEIVKGGMKVNQLEHTINDLRERADTDPVGDAAWSEEPVAPRPFPNAGPNLRLGETLQRLAVEAADEQLRRQGRLPAR